MKERKVDSRNESQRIEMAMKEKESKKYTEKNGISTDELPRGQM